MEKFVLTLICVSFSIWLVDGGPNGKNLSSVTSSDEGQFFPYKGGRSWTAENTPTNVTRYEGVHREDFLKNKDKYEVWPELNDQIPVSFCRKYIRKLFPSSFLAEPRPEKLPSINLHYTKIKGVNGDSLQHVNLAAVQCYLPKNSSRRYFIYIRAPRTQCVFLVKPLKNSAKSQFVNDFYIINEFCGDMDVNMDVDLDTSKEHQRNQDIHGESEKRKWTIRGQIKRETIPVQKKLKRKLLEEAPSEILVKYEKEHANDYVVNKDEYEAWPELKIKDTKSVCEKSIQKLFTVSFFKQVYPTVLRSEELQYVNLAKKHNQDSPQTVNVPILQCHIIDCPKRTYFLYIRTPRPNCLFVVKPHIRKTYRTFKIIDEVCEGLNISQGNSSLDSLAKVSVSHMIRKSKWNYECPIEVLQKYENAHYKEYNNHKDIYEQWLELDTLNKEILCKESIKQLFPTIMHHYVDASVITSAKLHYQYVTDDDEMTVVPSKVTVLQCYWEKSNRVKFFHFIKSTTVLCVFLVKNLAKNLQWTDFKIWNQFCVDSDEYKKLICKY